MGSEAASHQLSVKKRARSLTECQKASSLISRPNGGVPRSANPSTCGRGQKCPASTAFLYPPDPLRGWHVWSIFGRWPFGGLTMCPSAFYDALEVTGRSGKQGCC